MYHLNNLILLHGNFINKYRKTYAGEYFYWTLIKNAHERGIKSIDLGRSLTGSGNETAKMKWRPARIKLAYWYKLRKGEKIPRLNQGNRQYATAIKIWKQLPLTITKGIGPKLISGIL